MEDLLNKIKEHQNERNINICDILTGFIKTYAIANEDILKRIEDSFFTTDDISYRNMSKYREYCLDYTHLEKYDQTVIAKLTEYEKMYENANDEDTKTKALIFIYDLIEWDFIFPYTAYRLIVNDML